MERLMMRWVEQEAGTRDADELKERIESSKNDDLTLNFSDDTSGLESIRGLAVGYIGRPCAPPLQEGIGDFGNGVSR